MAPLARAADPPEKLCPDDTDVAYTVVRDDTLWNIAARSYCLNEWPPLYFGVLELAEYNRAEIGWDYDHIHAGTVVCLPQRITHRRWHGDRCASGVEEPTSGGAGICGNGRREGGEICDGADIRGLTCEMLDKSPGRLACRSDCKGFDTKGCGHGGEAAVAAVAPANPCATGPCGQCVQCCCSCGQGSGQGANGGANGADKEPARPKKPLVVRFSAEVMGGVAMPLTSEMRDHIYRLVGVVGAGVRVTIGPFEIAPRGFFLYGDHGTIFNDVEQAQTIIGGGALVQAGIALDFGAFRLTPGLEVGWIYTKRTITLNDYPFAGQIETQTGHLPLAGVFLRPAYNFGPKRRWSVALNLSADMILTRLGDNDVSTNFNTMLLGGVGYAF